MNLGIHKDWKPGRWTQGDQHLFILAAYLMAWVRVIDYATGDDPHTRPNLVAEIVMPLSWWAWAIGAALVGLLWSWRARCHFGVWMCHLLLGMLYAALGFGLLFSYAPVVGDFAWELIRTGSHIAFGYPPEAPARHPWSIDGVRQAGPLILVSMVHLFTCWRTGPDPLPDGVEEVDELTVKGTDG